MTRNQPGSAGQLEWPEVATAGSRIGGARYIFKRILGHGRWTQVWLGWDVKGERDVAVKVLPRSFLQEPQFLGGLDDAVRRSALLAHPAIARVYDFVCDYQVAAIVTEYVDGWPLAVVKGDRPEKRFGIEDVTLWVHQVCAALEYAHHGFCLVHRSLGPSNLLLNRREHLRVTDFALGHAVGRLAAALGNEHLGINAFMSPQQLQGAEVSVLDDIYALGATIFDLVTGTPPFYQAELQEQILNVPPPTMRERLQELGVDEMIPASWEATVAACLAKEPGRRPQSANDVIRSLERVEEAPPAPVPQFAGAETRQRAVELIALFAGKLSGVRSKAQDLLAELRATKLWRQLQDMFLRGWVATKRRAQESPALLRRNPNLILAITIGLVALNLALALWFFLRR